MEKERTTPENYPMSLNSLMAACNQTTNRDPVVSYDERVVEDTLFQLREKKLVSMIHQAGARVQKHRHQLSNFLELQPRDAAVLTVLLLRGPQTPGELRARTERIYPFSGLPEVEACLEELMRGEEPLVKMLPARPGQKEQRYVELLSIEVQESDPAPGQVTTISTGAPAPASSRLESLEEEVARLNADLQSLRDDFAAFRKQFE